MATLRLRRRSRAVLALAGATALLAAIPATSSAATARYSAQFGFNGPAGLYAYGMDWDASDNSILVGDYWNYRVKRFTTGGAPKGRASTPAPGGELGGITAPYDVEADLSDRPGGLASVWVADQGSSRIVQFTHNGGWLQTIGLAGGGTGGDHPGHAYGAGCGNGAMTIPTHIFADPSSGRLYVSDPRCRDVYIFTHSGGYVGSFDWPGGFTPIPRGIAADQAGNIYVVEHNTRAVYVFSKGGGFQRKFPRVDDMSDPRGLDVGSGLVAVVSAIKNKVYLFDKDNGRLLRSWGRVGGVGASGRAFDSIRFPAIDGNGNVYVGDTWGGYDNGHGRPYGYRVHKYSSAGKRLPWETKSAPPPKGGYNQQNGIALDRKNRLHVVDTFEQRVQTFRTGRGYRCPSRTTCTAWRYQYGSRRPAGPGSTGFGYPRALTYDRASNLVWVGDNNNAVLAWRPGKKRARFVHRFGTQGHGPGQFSGGVQGLRVVRDRLYARDFGNCRVQVFDKSKLLSVNTGSSPLVRTLGGCGEGAISKPRGVDVGPGGNVWVADSALNRITIWESGRLMKTVKPTGACALASPWGLTFHDRWAYVGSVDNMRIVRFRASSPESCEVVNLTGTPGPALRGANFVEFDSKGRMYVSDNSRRVLRYTLGG
jgi:tripartite motif-containing protein 71